MENSYGGVFQKWLIVFSEKGYTREIATLEKNVEREREKKEKALWHLGNQEYACEKDAVAEGKRFAKSLRYHRVEFKIQRRDRYEKRGRPAAGEEPTGSYWFIVGSLNENEEATLKS